MTQKTRDKVKGVYAAKPATPTVGVGHGRHQLDGRWGRAKTIFDSELYRTLNEWIEYALGHIDTRPSDRPLPDLEELCRTIGVTEAEWEALAMTGEGLSLRQVAGILEISHVAVRKRLLKARTKVLGTGLTESGYFLGGDVANGA